VVFVLSPSSARSEICAWEVEEATRVGKRILPVVCRPLEDASAPLRLGDLNYIFFYAQPRVPGSGFGSGLASLVATLNTDFDWMRDHTRYLQRALEWDAGRRPVNRLLSGNDILEAKSWAARRPKGAPEPTALQLDFIRASEQEAEARSNAQRQQLAAMAAAQTEREQALRHALVIVTLSALLAGWLWQRAEQQRDAAEQARTIAEEQRKLADQQTTIARQQTQLAKEQQARAETASAQEKAARHETEIALAGSYFHQSVTRLEGEKPFEALAYAARAVALNPVHEAARALMLDLLLWRPGWHRARLERPHWRSGKDALCSSGGNARGCIHREPGAGDERIT